MSKLEQLLQVDPHNELLFHLPSAAFVRLTNVSNKKVLFKIKTTAPKKYCVRPNSGMLIPNNHIDIVLSLQPFAYDPSEKNKHKFLIQSAVAPEGDVNLDSDWRNIPVDQIIDTKLRCIFEAPQEAKVHSEVNTSPLLINMAAGNNPSTNTTLREASQEMQQLKEQGMQIKEENVRLKEEILQLRKDIGSTITSPPSSISVKAETGMPLAFVISGMVLGIIGFLFGKYAF